MVHTRRNGVTWFTRLLIKLHLRSPRQVDIDEFDQWNIRDALESDSYWNWSNSRIIPKSREEFWEFLEWCDRISPETIKQNLDLDVKKRHVWINTRPVNSIKLATYSQKVMDEINEVEEYVKNWLPAAERAIKQLENQMNMSQILLRQYLKLKEDLQEKN